MADVKKRYDWSYYSTISALPDGISSVSNNGAVVLNNEIHVIFDGKHHYKWTGSTWESVSTLPYNFSWSSALVLINNEIHALGLLTEDGKDTGKGHYAWDGQNWREVSVLPNYFNGEGVAVYNGEIHLLGGDNNPSRHIKFNGSSWEEVSTLPIDIPWCQAIVSDDKIHVLDSNNSKLLAFDGTSWEEVSTLPYYTGGSARIVVIDDENHIFSGGDDWHRTHYRWDGTKWIDTSIIPYYLGLHMASPVEYNGVIYGFSDSAMYSIGKLVDDNDYDWDDIESLGDLPYDFVDGCVLKYNDEIHILGSSVSGNETKHYKYDGSSWEEVSTLPYDFYKGSAVIYGGVINILGGEEGPKNWYKFNGTSWESSVELPFDLVDGMAYVNTGGDYNELDKEDIEIVVGDDKYAGFDTYNNRWEVYTYDAVPAPVGKNSILFHNLQKHLFSGTYHYKYDGVWWLSANKNTLTGESWDPDSALPYDFHNGAAVSINGDIHILGSDTSGNGTKHYSWNSSTLTWEEVSTLPYDFHNGAAIVYDDEVYIFGGTNNTKGFTKIGSIVKPDPPTPPTPPEPPVPDTDYEYLNKEGLRHLIDLIKSDSVATYIGSFEKDTALYSHSARDILYFKDGFYKATSSIAEGDTIAVGLNIVGAGLDAGTVVYIWGFPNKDEKYNAIYMVNEDGTGTEYANNLSGSAEPAVDKTYTIKLNLADQNPETWCTRVEGNVTEIESGITENEIDDFMAYYPCMLLNGVEGKKLNPDNYAEDLNGVPVDIVSGSEGDAMVKFPARGYKVSRNGDEVTISITKERNKTGYTYPTYNGKNIKSFYESAYEGYINDGVLASLSGQNPTTNKKIGELRDTTEKEINSEEYYDWDNPERLLDTPLYARSGDTYAVNLNGEIHILGGENKSQLGDDAYRCHCKWNGSEWEEVSTLPCIIKDIKDGGWAVVINGEIHICGSTYDDQSQLRHYKWNGSEWNILPDDLISTSSNTVAYNDEIHTFKYDESSEVFKQYKFDGTNWVYVCDVPNLIGKSSDVYDGSIYNCHTENVYENEDIPTTELVSTMPYMADLSSVVVLNGEIHVLGGGDDDADHTKHQKWNGSEWEEVSTLPYSFCKRNAVVYHGEIHILGGYYRDGGNSNIHYKWNGSSWEEVSTIDSNVLQHNDFAVVFNDAIYIIGGGYRLAKWNGSEWETLTSIIIPSLSKSSLPVTYNDFIYTLLDNSDYDAGDPIRVMKYNETSGKQIISIPISSAYSPREVYNLMAFDGKLCVLCLSGNYIHVCEIKDNGLEKLLELPRMQFYDKNVIEFNNELHCVGVHYGRVETDADYRKDIPKKHYRFFIQHENRLINNVIRVNSYDGISWDEKDSLSLRIGSSVRSICRSPVSFKYGESCAAVLNDEIYALSQGVYSCDLFKYSGGSGFEKVRELSIGTYVRYGKCVSLNDKIFFNTSYGDMFKYDSDNLSKTSEMGSCPFSEGIAMVVLNNEIHILGGNFYSGDDSSKMHRKWNGSEWKEVSTLPYKFCNGSAVVLNGEIHILGGENNSKKHYKYNGSSWEEISTLPYDFYRGSAVVLNGEIHILGSAIVIYQKCHFVYDGSKWIQCEMLPYCIASDSVIVFHDKMYTFGFDGESLVSNLADDFCEISYKSVALPDFDMISMDDGIHMFCDTDEIPKYRIHLKYNGINTSVISYECFSNLYESLYALLNNELYVIGTGHHANDKNEGDNCFYKFGKISHNTIYDWSKNSEFDSLPVEVDKPNHITVYNNELHLINGTNHYKYTGSGWEEVSTLPNALTYGCILVLNNELHAVGLTVDYDYGEIYADGHYAWNGSEWEDVSRLPYDFNNTRAVVFDGEIHILGGDSDNDALRKHQKWNGSEWEDVSVLPYDFNSGCAIVLDGKIHILGGISDGTCRNHFAFDGIKWYTVTTLPFDFYSGNAAVINGDIHIFGSGSSSDSKKHYKLNSYNMIWEEVFDLPYEFLNGSTVKYKNEVYILGGTNSLRLFTKVGERVKAPYEQLTFNVLTYLQCCAIIKYKARNIQQVLGMGYTYNNSQPLMTGSMNERGLNWGEGSGNQGVKLFGLENPYGNLDKYVDGVYIDETGQLKVSDGDFNDTGDGYTAVGQPISAYRVFGFLKDILGITSGGFVSDGTVGGSDSTYFCDFTEIVPGKVATQGGNLNSGSLAGLTSLSLNVSPDSASSNTTARLTYFDVDED